MEQHWNQVLCLLKDSKETFHMMQDVYDKESMACANVFHRHKTFSKSRKLASNRTAVSLSELRFGGHSCNYCLKKLSHDCTLVEVFK
jgi:hypothetical protein